MKRVMNVMCAVATIWSMNMAYAQAANQKVLGSHDGYDGECHYRFEIVEITESDDSRINCFAQVFSNGEWLTGAGAVELWNDGMGFPQPSYTDLFDTCDSIARIRCGELLGGGGVGRGSR